MTKIRQKHCRATYSRRLSRYPVRSPSVDLPSKRAIINHTPNHLDTVSNRLLPYGPSDAPAIALTHHRLLHLPQYALSHVSPDLPSREQAYPKNVSQSTLTDR